MFEVGMTRAALKCSTFQRFLWIAREKRGAILLAIVTGFFAPACSSTAPGTIGAALGQQSDHHVFIRSAPPGQGADKAGLLVDDEVVALDGKPVLEMTPDDIRRAVRGDVGSTLVVTILRHSPNAQPERRDIRVTRTPLLAEKAK